jgi:hypothetical protein
MSAMGDAIDALRGAVMAAEAASAAGIPEALAGGLFEAPEIVAVPGEATLDHVSVRPVNRMTIDDLTAEVGQPRRLPARPSPHATRTVLFPGTLPAERSIGATVLAEVDADGLVSRLIVRRDVL